MSVTFWLGQWKVPWSWASGTVGSRSLSPCGSRLSPLLRKLHSQAGFPLLLKKWPLKVNLVVLRKLFFHRDTLGQTSIGLAAHPVASRLDRARILGPQHSHGLPLDPVQEAPRPQTQGLEMKGQRVPTGELGCGYWET